MADVLLTLLSPTPLQGVQQTAITGNASQHLAALPEVAIGSILTGFVLNRDAKGQPIVRTERGDVLLQSELFLKIGSEVLFRVESGGQQTRARILSVDGHSPAEVQTRPPHAPEQDAYAPSNLARGREAPPRPAPPAASPALPPPAAPPPRPVLQGVVVAPPAPAVPSPPATASAMPLPFPNALPPGTRVTMHVLGAEMPAANPISFHAAVASLSPATPARASPLPFLTSLVYGAYTRLTAPPTPPSATPPQSVPPGAFAPPPAAPPPVTPAAAWPVFPGLPATASLPHPASAPPLPPVHVQAAAVPSPILPPSGAFQPPTAALPIEAGSFSPASPPSPQQPASASPTLPLLSSAAPAKTAIASSYTASLTASAPTAQTSPAPTITTPAPAPAGGVPAVQRFVVTVAGVEKSGDAVLQTPVGTIKITSDTPLAPGARLLVELTAPTAGQFSASPPPLARPALPATPLAQAVALAEEWPALKEAVAVLMQGDEKGVESLLQRLIPWVPGAGASPSAQAAASQPSFSAGLMLFLTLMQRGQGDLAAWLGERQITQLKKMGRADLAQRLETDFLSLRQTTQSVQHPQQWQPLFFPVLSGGELHQARLFVKRERKRGGKLEEGEGLRFILEVELSQLGDVQMDGFARKQERVLHFDMVIRSDAPFPGPMQAEMLGIFDQAARATGYRGGLTFQVVREFPIHPLESLLSEGKHSIFA